MSTSLSRLPQEDRAFQLSKEPTSSMENNQGTVTLSQLRSDESLLDRTRPLPTSLQSDFIPDDVLMALTQAPVPREHLGPVSRHRNLCTTVGPAKQKPANVWNFKRRDRFKHLTESTPCICGSGKDISFLYDVPQPRQKVDKDDGFDPSAVRKEMDERRKTGLKLPDTLLPDEYHIVKNKGVMGIEYHEDKYTTNADDHEKHLVMFPSLKPAGRFEVVQLKQAMEDLLDKSGVNDADVEIKGPTQMHNLLELIKKEQNIYNVIFHELIRQVSVECVERGELLSDLRNKYSDLLNKVPHQIKSLHEEVLAQRALDRRLTEELMRFKATITILTNELSEVKEHDRRVTREAQDAQEDLRSALSEAQKNASLLAEYHELYELQRRRLEKQVTNLTEEKEIWSTASYCLALKVTEESKLTTAKSLHVSEKAWSKLANHFTILLSDKDTEILTQIQSYVEKWQDLIENFDLALKKREDEMKRQLKVVQNGLAKWNTEYQEICFSKDGHFQSAPDADKVQQLLDTLKGWEQVLTQVNESLIGETFLSSEEELIYIRKHMDSWTDSAIKCFGRHRGVDGANHPELETMVTLNEEVDALLNQYFIRLTGENGAAQGIIHLLNVFETWTGKLSSHINGSAQLKETEWSRFNLLIEEWLNEVSITIESIGSTQKADDRTEGRPHVRRDIHDVVRKCQKWVTTSTNSVDSEDAKLVEQVGSLHSEMIKWMVQVLLRLAPNRGDNSKEAADMSLIGSSSIPQLQTTAKSLFERLTSFSKYVTLCCDGIVMDNTQIRRDNREEDPDHEYRDLQRVRLHEPEFTGRLSTWVASECTDWVRTAKILMSQLTGEAIEILFPEPGQLQENLQEQKSIPKPSYTYRDHETVETQKSVDEPKQGDSTEDSRVKTTPEQASTAVPGVSESSSQGQEEARPEDVTKQDPAQPSQSAEMRNDAVPDGEEEKETVEMIGFDSNTHVHNLEEVAEVAPDPVPSHMSDRPATPMTPRSKKAFEAVAALESLQTQLLATEERCQNAEERATAAESELTQCHEKLRALERLVTQLQGEGSKTKVNEPAEKSLSAGAITPVRTERQASRESVASDGRSSKDGQDVKPDMRPRRSDSRSSSKGSKGRKK